MIKNETKIKKKVKEKFEGACGSSKLTKGNSNMRYRSKLKSIRPRIRKHRRYYIHGSNSSPSRIADRSPNSIKHRKIQMINRLHFNQLKSRKLHGSKYSDHHNLYPTKRHIKHNMERNQLCKQGSQHRHDGNICFDTDSFQIGIDNHSSKCISNNLKDFVGPISECSGSLTGISGKLKIIGTGKIRWKIEDDQGKVHAITIRDALYVPDADLRLLSPQHWSQSVKDHKPQRNGTWSATYHDKVILFWNQGKFRKTVKLNPGTNVAIFSSAHGFAKFDNFTRATKANKSNYRLMCRPVTIENESNDLNNLYLTSSKDKNIDTHTVEDNVILQAETDQAELLRWHYRLNHISFKKLKSMALLGFIPKKLAKVRAPKCASCMFGGLTRRPWSTKGPSNRKSIFVSKKPGECVSVDQMESPVPGFIGHLKGRLTRQRYNNATIFVDHASRLSFVYLQTALTSQETVKAKLAFESYARRHNVRVLHYHADNGRFSDNAFMEEVRKQQQTISFCGVNSHFQNGIAEKRIRDLQEKARTALLHAQNRWKEAIHVSLWPFALTEANNVLINVPSRPNGASMIEEFTGVPISPSLKHFHVFGCPVYALNSNLQGGKQISKWNSRARVGAYLGKSPRHSRSVSLVLNLTTGHVSPQYHIQHDDFFETVASSAGNPKTKSMWQTLAGLTSSNKETLERPVMPNLQDSFNETNDVREVNNEQQIQQPDSETDLNEFVHEHEKDDQIFEGPPNDEGTTPQRRSNRVRRMTDRMRESLEQATGNFSYALTYYDRMHEFDYEDQVSRDSPISYLAKTDQDTMYLHQAMQEPDRDRFIQAIIKEVNDHIERKHWELISRRDVPKGEDILDAVWSMKRKRKLVSREPYKWKARLNIHGGQQEYGVHYYDTYSPVVTWPTIRLLLTMSILNGWASRQIDFVLAYPQADIEQDLYMNLPKGIVLSDNKSDYVLKIRKNLYGSRNASRTFFLFMKEKLLSLGYKPSSIDECVFYRGSTVFFAYVDDGIFLDKSLQRIDLAVVELGKICEIEDKGDISDYLGVHFSKKDSGDILLNQTHLIDQILKELQLSPNGTVKPTPAASTKILHRFKDESSHVRNWHYRSIIGKLNFLEKSTRPDISHATHQCARFSQDPKQSHSDAVMHLGKYLAGTRTQGIRISPNNMASFEVYADADFAGQWNKLTSTDDESTAKSRTGYIVFFSGCPLIWTSKLQTMIGLSTTECEYMALSEALRATLPLMDMVDELRAQGICIYSSVPRVFCKAFEDNSGALELAKMPKMRPRTKHINQVFHHFRSYVRSGRIKIYPIKSEDQLADAMTKPQPQNLFVPLRKRVMGW